MKYLMTVKSSIIERLCHAEHMRDFWCERDKDRAAEYERNAAEIRMGFDSTKLSAEIGMVQGRARVRVIDETDVVRAFCRLHNSGLHGAAFRGVSVIINPNAQTFPGAYHGIPESTYFNATYDGRAWHVISVWRRQCGTKKFVFSLTPAAQNAIIAAALDAI